MRLRIQTTNIYINASCIVKIYNCQKKKKKVLCFPESQLVPTPSLRTRIPYCSRGSSTSGNLRESSLFERVSFAGIRKGPEGYTSNGT